MTLKDRDRRREAKRFNERLKLLATFLNNSGIATLVGGFVLPFFSDKRTTLSGSLVALALACAAHMLAQAALTLLRSED